MDYAPLLLEEVYNLLVQEHEAAATYCHQLADVRIVLDTVKRERDELLADELPE